MSSAILDALALGPGDHLLELRCGGLLLRNALASCASATGLEHSEEMVELARERADGELAALSRQTGWRGVQVSNEHGEQLLTACA